MFKFLRKYNKLMLAIFGVLLMITFLIPQAFDRFAQSSGASGAVLATLGDGDKFYGYDLERARRELRIIEQLGQGIPGLGEVKSPEHWFLLTREAEAAGLVSTGESMKPSEQLVAAALAGTGERDPGFVRQTLAKFIGVAQLMALHQTSGLYSDRYLMRTAERLMHQVNAQTVIIEADAERVNAEPTDEQITAQMEKYADVAPGEGETSFGYKLPDRIKVEWLTISADSVRKAVEQSPEFSAVAQRKHWRRNANKTFPAVDENAAQVPQVVRDDLLDQLTNEKRESIANFASAQLSMNRRGLAEQDGYVVLPPDWDQKKLDFQQLAASIRERHGVELPAYQSSGDRWIPVAEVNTLEGIGASSTSKFGSTPIRFNQLVAAAKEFGASLSERGVASVVPIQESIAGPPLEDADGSLYVFRIIATDPAHSPTSVDEVRDAVVRDIKRELDYQRLRDAAAELEQKAEEQGLLSVAIENGTSVQSASVSLTDMLTLQQRIQFGFPITVDPSPLPLIGKSRKASEAIIDYSLSLPSDTPLDNLTEQQRVTVVPVEDKLAVAVVRLVRQTPLTRERFAELAQNGAVQALIGSEDDAEGETLADAFSFDAMAKRHNFVPTRSDEAPESDQPPAESAASAR